MRVPHIAWGPRVVCVIALVASVGVVTFGSAAASTPVYATGLSGFTGPDYAGCVSPTTCIAVGQGLGGGSDLVSVPITSGGGEGFPSDSSTTLYPDAMACASSTICLVGGVDGSAHGAVATVGLGGVGAAQDLPNTGAVTGIGCASSTLCYALTTLQNTWPFQPVVVSIVNGTVQSTTPIPDSTGVTLTSLACETPTQCVAVGSADGSGTAQGAVAVPITNGQPQAPTWLQASGSGWAFTSVACPTSDHCYAVGNGVNSGVSFGFGAEITAGGISAADGPGLPAGQQDNLYGIACETARSCVAVGDYNADPADPTKSQMAYVPMVNGSFGQAQLIGTGVMNGVACPSASKCIATGVGLNEESEVATFSTTPANTSTSVDAWPANSTYGQPVSLEALVQVTDPFTVTPFADGSVTFTVGSTVLGTAPLSVVAGSEDAAQITTSALPAGTQYVTATYSGNADFATSSNTIAVTVAPASTTLAAASVTKSLGNFSATLTRQDDGTPVVGQLVTFKTAGLNTADTICSARTDSSGIAACTAKIPLLDRLLDSSYTASFAGSANYTSATASGALTGLF